MRKKDDFTSCSEKISYMFLPIVGIFLMQANQDCNVRSFLNPVNDDFITVGITSACTIFVVPNSLILNSNFLNQLKLIDSDRKKVCYGVKVYILQNTKQIVIFLRQARFAVLVNCIWKFNGKLFYCNPIYRELLFFHGQRKACTNLIQFDNGFSFFCTIISNYVFEKITYINNEFHIELIRKKSTSLFVKQNSNIVLITNDTSNTAGFYQVNIFDNIFVEQLASTDICKSKGQVYIGLIGVKKYGVNLMEIRKKILENTSLEQCMSDYITVQETTMNQTKWFCIARFDESDYVNVMRYKKPYLEKFVSLLYKSIAESKKQTNISQALMIRYETNYDKMCLSYTIRVIILMVPVLSTIIIPVCLYR